MISYEILTWVVLLEEDVYCDVQVSEGATQIFVYFLAFLVLHLLGECLIRTFVKSWIVKISNFENFLFSSQCEHLSIFKV